MWTTYGLVGGVDVAQSEVGVLNQVQMVEGDVEQILTRRVHLCACDKSKGRGMTTPPLEQGSRRPQPQSNMRVKQGAHSQKGQTHSSRSRAP